MISQLAVFERSCCACRQCRQFCRARPGVLAPSDLDHIADYLGLPEPTPEFVEANFAASGDGPQAPTDAFPSGRTPAIRPKVRDDGTCVFLDRETERCTIHPVAPFECGRADACDEPAGAAAMRSLGIAITKSADYVMTWWWLRGRQGE